jgi:hypothetical protein
MTRPRRPPPSRPRPARPARAAAARLLGPPAALAALAGAPACSDDDGGEVVTIPYAIGFPSVAAAVAADEVQVGAYPDAGESTCLSLVQKRRSQQVLPAPVAPPVSIAPCDVADAPAIETGVGRVALLAVARRQGADFLIGCAVQDVARGVAPASIPLALFSNAVAVPATACTTLSSHCGGACE